MSLKRHFVVAGWTLGTGPSGATRRLLSIARAMPPFLEPGERVTLLHARADPPPDVPPEVRLEPIDVPAAPTWRRVLTELRGVRRTLENVGADLLDLGTLPVPRGLPCPVVLTVHDLRDLHAAHARHPRWLARRVLRRSVARSRALVTPSEFTAGELRRALGNLLPPTEIVPGGAEDRLLGLEPRAPRGRPHFLHVGHLEPRKNLLMLLSAYATFLEEAGVAPDTLPSLVLVGKDAGARATLYERAVMLELLPHVHFGDAVEEEQLLALYAGATAVLLPSKYEGFGLPALEALAVGVPTVVADAGALPEVVGQVAQILPPDDTQAWARAMADWHAEPRNVEAIAARKTHAGRSTWAASAAATLEAWRRACNP